MVVLDTSAVIYWTLDPARLSPLARNTIDTADNILISAISIWEIGIKMQKGKLHLPLTLREFTHRLALVRGVVLVPVSVEIWLLNLELPWSHRDPADRTIVATAHHFECPLVTSEERIRDFYPHAIW